MSCRSISNKCAPPKGMLMAGRREVCACVRAGVNGNLYFLLDFAMNLQLLFKKRSIFQKKAFSAVSWHTEIILIFIECLVNVQLKICFSNWNFLVPDHKNFNRGTTEYSKLSRIIAVLFLSIFRDLFYISKQKCSTS